MAENHEAQQIVNTISREISPEVKRMSKEDWRGSTLSRIRNVSKEMEIAEIGGNKIREDLNQKFYEAEKKAKELGLESGELTRNINLGRLSGAIDMGSEKEIEKYMSLLQSETPPKSESW